MSVTRRLQAATILRAAPPVLLLLAAMGVPSLAGPVTVVLAAGAAIAIGRSAPVAWAWAAVVPAGALATARAFSGIVPSVAAAACEASGSPRVTWAVAEALVVLATFTALAIGLRTRRASVGVRMPARSAVRLAAGGFGILGIGSVVAVSVVRGAIPGPTGGDPSTAAFVAAVLVGAAAIALAEELAFRGVLQHWARADHRRGAGDRRPGGRVRRVGGRGRLGTGPRARGGGRGRRGGRGHGPDQLDPRRPRVARRDRRRAPCRHALRVGG